MGDAEARSRRWRRRVVAVLAGTLVALVAAEIVLRLAWTPPAERSTPSFGPHPAYTVAPLAGVTGVFASWEYEHGFTHTAQGLRGRVVFGAEPAAGIEKRVLFLGDSFTYGIGSEDDETFVALLDAAWPRAEVANGGVNGYGTREALAFLDRFGAAFRPDLTVLVFFWNDLEDNVGRTKPEFRLDDSGRVVRVDPVAGAPVPLAELPAADVTRERSHFPLYLHQLVKAAARGLRYRTTGIRPRRIRTPEQAAEAWTVTERLLGLLARRAAEIGTRLVVTSVPDHNQVDPEARIENIEPLNFEVQDRLAQVCAAAGVPCLDFRAAMKAHFERTGERLYYYADRHLTPAGNRVFARHLQPQLETLLNGTADG